VWLVPEGSLGYAETLFPFVAAVSPAALVAAVAIALAAPGAEAIVAFCRPELEYVEERVQLLVLKY
jgi:hypothetical protein